MELFMLPREFNQLDSKSDQHYAELENEKNSATREDRILASSYDKKLLDFIYQSLIDICNDWENKTREQQFSRFDIFVRKSVPLFRDKKEIEELMKLEKENVSATERKEQAIFFEKIIAFKRNITNISINWNTVSDSKIRSILHDLLRDIVILFRNVIARRYIRLLKEKHSIYDKKHPIPLDYNRRLLQLIYDILLHTQINWKIETDKQRKGSLHNLVRVVLLLTRDFTSLYNRDYVALKERSTENNFWRNLVFLVQCEITQPGPGTYQRFPISYAEINEILQECFKLIDNVLHPEIRLGLELQRIKQSATIEGREITGDTKLQYEAHDRDVRQPFRNPHVLPFLHAFSTYKREQLRIEKMLQSITLALDHSRDMNSPVDQIALLRQLQVLGESITGKNFSKPTKRLVDDVDWQLFVRLRNKLSHNEWDIRHNHLQKNLLPPILTNIQQDLKQLKESLQLLREHHREIGMSMDNMLHHYSPAWYLRPETQTKFMQFIRDICSHRLINPQEFKRLKALLKEDIRDKNLPMLIQKSIVQIFDKGSPNYNMTKHFLPRFQGLVKAYKKETKYHQNLENPDNRTQQRIDRRLASHQTSIRAFYNMLDYSERTYNDDRSEHPSSFDALSLIQLILHEINAIKCILRALLGSDLVKELDFPEDVTQIHDPKLIRQLFNSLCNEYKEDDEVQRAITHIKEYYFTIGSPLRLEINGLHAVDRGEMATIYTGLLFKNLSHLRNPIKTFGQKCFFYTGLARNPKIVEACFYHMARIQKYVVVLCLSSEVPTARLPHFQEFRALRNFIHHGSDLFETMDINSREFMVRYASMFLRKLLPSIEHIKNLILDNRVECSDRVNSLVDYSIYGNRRAERQQTGDSEITSHRERSLSF
jgi:uncharacterized protein with HEPN domain